MAPTTVLRTTTVLTTAAPMTAPRLASELWSVIKNDDWVLTANTLEDWALRLWDMDSPARHPGRSFGTATQIAVSLGVGLAYRDTNKLVVDIQPDGDLMFDPGALWTAANSRIPKPSTPAAPRPSFDAAG